MSKIKLVAMDLDNTLLDSEKQISKHTEEVLKEAIRRGVYIVPATGRIFKAIPEFLRDIPGVRYAVCCNGATVYDQKEDRIIYTNHLPKETVFSLFDILEKYLDHTVVKSNQREDIEQAKTHLRTDRKTALQHTGALPGKVNGLAACKQC